MSDRHIEYTALVRIQTCPVSKKKLVSKEYPFHTIWRSAVISRKEHFYKKLNGIFLEFWFLSEESVVDIEEEIMVPDEPPDYEPPPEYSDLVKMKYLEAYGIDTKR